MSTAGRNISPLPQSTLHFRNASIASIFGVLFSSALPPSATELVPEIYRRPQGPTHSEWPCTGLPQNGQKRTERSRTASPPPCTGVFATVSLRTSSSKKKCRPPGNERAICMSLQQGSNDRLASVKIVPRARRRQPSTSLSAAIVHLSNFGDPMSLMGLCVQPVSATPLVVYRLAFRSPRSFADVD